MSDHRWNVAELHEPTGIGRATGAVVDPPDCALRERETDGDLTDAVVEHGDAPHTDRVPSERRLQQSLIRPRREPLHDDRPVHLDPRVHRPQSVE